MKISTKKNKSLGGKSSFKPRRVHYAVLLALGPTMAIQAGAQGYVNYDGSKASDLNAALATWTSSAEFQKDWGARGMNAQYAYALGFNGTGVKIGAVDSGIFMAHPEFNGRSAVVPVAIQGSYLFDGGQEGQTWKAGDKFSVPGDFDSRVNNLHGTLVSGTIAAAKDGQGTMGMAFGSQFLTTNTNGTDNLLFNKDRDYNYFNQAYGALAEKGVRVINSSWGSKDDAEDYGTPANLAASYRLLQRVDPVTGVSERRSWLDAAVDVTKKTGVIQVFSAGNTGYANASVRGALPYFRPEMEANWLTVTGLDKDESHLYNSCGVAKYWCIGGPTNTQSTSASGTFANFNGTSAAAPHVTGALGVLMQRYPSLGNREIRTILLTTARQPRTLDAATGKAVTTLTPDATFGWGVPDLNKGMDGPGQFLGVFDASLPAGMSDTWRNSISEAALIQRKSEDATEISAWTARKAALGAASGIPANLGDTVTAAMPAKIPDAVALVKKLQDANHPPYTGFNAAQSAVDADPVAKALLSLYAKNVNAGWYNAEPASSEFTNYMATFANSTAIAQAALAIAPTLVSEQMEAIKVEYQASESRSVYLSSLTAANYVGSLVKSGAGSLTLTGDNSYSGGTQLQGGTLGVGSSTALGTGTLAMSDATTLQAAADGLSLANAVTLSGIGNIDTQAYGLTLSGAMTDGATAGGFAKLGTGTLTLSGANTYSGPTVVAAGTLQAGAVNTFSGASAMTVNTGATLNLTGYNQRVAGMNLAGTVVVAGTPSGTVLTVAGPWVGNGGLLKLGSVSPMVSDHVLLSGPAAVASGITMVQVGNFTGLGGATVGNGIELVGTTGGASVQGNAFVLAGDHVDAGAYEYRLNNIGSGGYLSSSSPRGQTYYRSEVPQYAALPAQLRQASLAMLGNMHQRAGDDDVKTASGKPQSVDSTDNTIDSDNRSQRRAWGRVLSTNLDIRQSGTVSPQSHGRLDGFQAGTDLLSVRNWRAGVYVGQLDGEMGVSGFVRGVQGQRVGGNSLHNQYLGAYGTYASDNGLYADAVLQSGRHSYNFVNPLTQSGSAGGGKGRSLLASLEVGQSFELGSGGNWKVEPQLQLIHQRLSLDDVTLAGSTQVRQHPDSAWLARLGVRVKGEVGMGAGRLQPYARFNLYRASNGNDVASFSASGGRTAINSSTGGTSAELAAGATLALTPTFGLYGEIGKLWSAGGDTRVKSSVQGSAGARVLW